MTRLVFISTGVKSVMHTLWVQNIVQRPNPPVNEPSRLPMLPAMIHYNYIKNLSMDEEIAVKEAKNYAEEHGGDFIGVLDSPASKRAKFFEAFGMHFTQRRKKGKTFFMGEHPTDEFWDAWRKNKEEMKQSGFTVSKFLNPMKRSRHGYEREEWYVFYGGE